MLHKPKERMCSSEHRITKALNWGAQNQHWLGYPYYSPGRRLMRLCPSRMFWHRVLFWSRGVRSGWHNWLLGWNRYDRMVQKDCPWRRLLVAIPFQKYEPLNPDQTIWPHSVKHREQSKTTSWLFFSGFHFILGFIEKAVPELGRNSKTKIASGALTSSTLRNHGIRQWMQYITFRKAI